MSFHGWSYGAFVLQTLWTASESGTPAQTDSAPASQQTSSSVAVAGRSSGTTESYPGPEQGYAVECADSPNPRNPDDYRALATFAYARSGGAGPNTSWFDEPCSTWQASEAYGYFGPWDRQTTNPVLVVGNTYDPGHSLPGLRPYGQRVGPSPAADGGRLWAHSPSQPEPLRQEVREQLFRQGGAAANRDRLPTEPTALLHQPGVVSRSARLGRAQRILPVCALPYRWS